MLREKEVIKQTKIEYSIQCFFLSFLLIYVIFINKITLRTPSVYYLFDESSDKAELPMTSIKNPDFFPSDITKTRKFFSK